MPRPDLLALSTDDLASITNRGTVKRAQREFESGSPAAEIHESAEVLVVKWSDGIECRFPADAPLDEAVCSSGSAGISRHIIRSVFAYQAHQSNQASESQDGDSGDTVDAERLDLGVSSEPWDPGERIGDDALIAEFTKRTVTRARKRFEAGVLVELIRSPKPYARLLDHPCVVRFLVPGDVRYVYSDAADSGVGEFVCMSVWAFRKLAADSNSGIVSTQTKASAPCAELLQQIRTLLVELAVEGIANVPPSWIDRMRRCEVKCRDEELTWPAEIVADLVRQKDEYASHDASFDPLNLLHDVGELLVRLSASESDQRSVPQTLVRGSRSDRVHEISGARLVGLGCDAAFHSAGATLTAYLQDSATGTMMSLRRAFKNPEETERLPSVRSLSDTSVYKGFSLAGVARGQLVLKTAKRSASHVLSLPRTAGMATVNPQGFAWESLRPPNSLESFAEVRARLQLLPPASLRPRRATENIFVCAIQCLKDVVFDSTVQAISATLVDHQGDTATLSHGYTSRGRGAFENFAAALDKHSDHGVFISGEMSLRRGGLSVRPLAVIFEHEGRRWMCQPWIDEGEEQANADNLTLSDEPRPPLSPGLAFLSEWQLQLADFLMTGIRDVARSTAFENRWREMSDSAKSIGTVRFAEVIDATTRKIGSHRDDPQWSDTGVAETLLPQWMVLRLASDLT